MCDFFNHFSLFKISPIDVDNSNNATKIDDADKIRIDFIFNPSFTSYTLCLHTDGIANISHDFNFSLMRVINKNFN